MRELKFRAWDGERMWKYAVPLLPGCVAYNGGVANACQEEGGGGNRYLIDPILMQYTGLKDKNGKEIYEGDILRRPAKNSLEMENYTALEVFWHGDDSADSHVGFQCNRVHYFGNICGGLIEMKMIPKCMKQLEVIGNIYENGELLNG